MSDTIIIEGTLRHQDNVMKALNKFGNMFEGDLIMTDYFGDFGNKEMIDTLVPSNDKTLVLGKPRYADMLKNKKFMVKLVDKHKCGLYSIDIIVM